MDIFGEQYVAYKAHIIYNRECYTFTEKWGTTHITDAFQNDPNNPKWSIYKDNVREEMQQELQLAVECMSAIGAIKALIKFSTSNDKADSKKPEENTKEKPEDGSYAPDRSKPRNSDGTPCPDEDEPIIGPHTQLGKNRDGSYNQAREFDADGKPVKDIDFTNHGRPNTHPNPHEHPYIPNPAGGTPSRGPSQTLKK